MAIIALESRPQLHAPELHPPDQDALLPVPPGRVIKDGDAYDNGAPVLRSISSKTAPVVVKPTVSVMLPHPTMVSASGSAPTESEIALVSSLKALCGNKTTRAARIAALVKSVGLTGEFADRVGASGALWNRSTLRAVSQILNQGAGDLRIFDSDELLDPATDPKKTFQESVAAFIESRASSAKVGRPSRISSDQLIPSLRSLNGQTAISDAMVLGLEFTAKRLGATKGEIAEACRKLIAQMGGFGGGPLFLLSSKDIETEGPTRVKKRFEAWYRTARESAAEEAKDLLTNPDIASIPPELRQHWTSLAGLDD